MDTIPYLEIIDRSRSGPHVQKNDWDMEYIVLPVRRLVKQFNLAWDKTNPIPQDNDLIDRLFHAGLELAASSGIFCVTTGQVIQFSRDELSRAMQSMPQELTMGTGVDARTLFSREIMDNRPPLVWAGNPGAPTPQELFIPCVKSWAQEPIVDLITCGSITHIDNHTVESGTPLEIHAARWELSQLRQVLRDIGRPGMGMLAGQSAVTEIGDLAIAHPDYLRPRDAHLVALFNELIIDQVNISRALNSVQYGMRNASLATVMVGGLAGDAPGAAVVQIASFILANLVCRAHYHLLHPIHIRHVSTSTFPVMWVQSAVTQAFVRNAPCIIVSDIYPKSGALTPELLYEVAANAVAITVSGGHLEGVGAADGLYPNGSGLEARWMGEVGHAVARQNLSLDQANALILKLFQNYSAVFEQPSGNPGVRFDHAYNMEHITPLPSWKKLYEQVKEEVHALGLSALTE